MNKLIFSLIIVCSVGLLNFKLKDTPKINVQALLEKCLHGIDTGFNLEKDAFIYLNNFEYKESLTNELWTDFHRNIDNNIKIQGMVNA